MVKMKQNTPLDRHHVSYSPPKVVLIPHRGHQRIHNNLPIINPLNLKMRQYDKLVNLCRMIKNWTKAYKREFGEEPIDVGLAELERKKKEILKEVKLLIDDDLAKVQHIKGLGVRYLAGLLAYAHPNRFPNVGRYLYYCGYTNASKITKRYSRKTSSLVHQVAVELIRGKDPKYYPLYLKIKEEQPKDFPKIKKHRIAINKMATIFLKEFYYLFREQ